MNEFEKYTNCAIFKEVIEMISKDPQRLHLPQYKFLKDFVEQMGGKVPEKPESPPTNDAGKCEFETKNVDSDPESDVELDMSGVIEGDQDEPQPMGDSAKVPTEEEMDQASDLRGKAACAFSERNYAEAIDLYTKAIQLNPGNALFHAKRGQAYLKLQKPNACIRDCDKALELNCDSAAGYKFRGRAHRLLGNWEMAAKDLRQACKLDYDEESDEWLKEVTPNAKLLAEHKIKKERKKIEKELNKRQNEPKTAAPDLGMFSFMTDPEIGAAVKDILQNPSNISKYQSNPKIMDLIKMIYNGQNAPPTFTGPAGGPPTAPPPTATPKPDLTDFSDDGLD